MCMWRVFLTKYVEFHLINSSTLLLKSVFHIFHKFCGMQFSTNYVESRFQQVLWNFIFPRFLRNSVCFIFNKFLGIQFSTEFVKNICPVEFNFLPADEFLGSFITCMKPDITNYFILSLIYQLPLLS